MSQLISLFNRKSHPIWFMRQAGRYLPEYMKIRSSVNNFLELCYDPQKASEVTLQPIKRFGFDAAIIFSDILVLPDALGWSVKFEENIGPVLQQFKSEDDFKYLDGKYCERLEKVYLAISNTKKGLPKDTPLIGFAGSPWTVTTYLLEGRGKQDFSLSKKFIYQNRNLAKKLIDLLTERTIIHLEGQIKAGCDIIQLFDSWAGMLSGLEYDEFVIEPTKKIVSALNNSFPKVPIIGFPKGSGFLYEKYMDNTGIDCIGVDQFVPIDLMKKWQKNLVVQGNIDPVILLTDKETIARKADEILSNLVGENFIFNLGHGILPSTPVNNVEFLVDYVKNFKKSSDSFI